MEINHRKKYKKILQSKYAKYIKDIGSHYSGELKIDSRFSEFVRNVVSILMKEKNSENGYKLVKKVASDLFGLKEDIKRLKLPGLDFSLEESLINNFLIEYLNERISSNYFDKLASYGESLLCGYIDCLLNASKLNVDKTFGMNPHFLINPNTNNLLEIDVALKEYRLYFEFQGHPSHYEDRNTIAKDRLKLQLCFSNNVVLVPINIYQLNSRKIIIVIINTIKDNLGIKELIKGENINIDTYSSISDKQLLQFSRLMQKLYLCEQIYGETLNFLDTKSNLYIQNMQSKNPSGFSQHNDAPRFINDNEDYEIEDVYYGIKYLSKLRKQRRKENRNVL